MAGNLTGDGEPVLVKEIDGLEIRAVRGLGVGGPEQLAVELKAVAQDVERALGVQLLDQRGDEQWFQVCSVERPHLGPELRLSGPDEGAHLRGEQRQLLVPVCEVAPRPAALGQQDLLDVGFEGVFVGLAHSDFLQSFGGQH